MRQAHLCPDASSTSGGGALYPVVRGFTPVVVMLTFTAGLQMTMPGVLGEDLWRTLDETRRRPPCVIDRVPHRET